MKAHPSVVMVLFAVLASLLGAQTAPLRIEQTVELQFPHALSLSLITEGHASVVVNIGADGKLVDWLVTGYTDKAFADEAVYALQRWRYTAPIEEGQPIGIRTEFRFEFQAKGRVVSLMAIETPEVLLRQMGIEPRYTARVCSLHELDRPLTPVNPASPAYPASAGASAQPRSVLVDFYVDENGQPRMPVVVNSPHHHFARAAMDALSQWRFTAPTRAGKPMAVRVRQEFVFPGRS